MGTRKKLSRRQYLPANSVRESTYWGYYEAVGSFIEDRRMMEFDMRAGDLWRLWLLLRKGVPGSSVGRCVAAPPPPG